MIRANFVSPKGAWQAKAADSILLDYDQRNANGAHLATTRGLEFMVDLPQAVTLRGGDALVLEDGRLIEIVAAPESLSEMRVAEPRDLARLAWHLGGQHRPAQILANRIRVRADAVIEDMARALGAKIARIEAPFDPEGGAYAGPDVEDVHVHGPDCGHDHHGHEHHARDHQPHGHDGHHDRAKHDHHDHAKHGHEHHGRTHD